MTAPLPLPALPRPARLRWQPLRMGLVELYHYDCEEFWFRDGHLMLRGNNGTGKSKVLSLTLPFLLDANLGSARVEPDGDRGKRMEWNVLMGRHERRTGYAWIEFGRRDEAGDAHYLTLGCGLSAVAGRQRVETWHFLTEQRMGEELWLVTPDRVVVSRERLAERLAGRGQIFETAQDYRRAVDERLYRFGEERYRALMDTLIQLRQPQLSRRPDEQTLSDALTEALPPLPQATLEDVAEAMTQLDEYRHELAELESLREGVAQFVKRYGVYARVQARRQARVLRQAQTDFDSASRILNEARTALETAQADVEASEARRDKHERQQTRDRATLDELQRDPVMRDARRLREAEDRAHECTDDATQAQARSKDAVQRLQDEQTASTSRRQESAQALAGLTSIAQIATQAAASVGLASEHEKASAMLLPFDALGERRAEDIDALLASVRDAVVRRREHVAQIRGRLGTLDQAGAARNNAAETRNVCLAMFEAAQARAVEADTALSRCAGELVEHWRTFLDGLTALAMANADDLLDRLAAWVESLAGENPALDALVRSQQEAALRLAEQEAGMKRRQAALREEADALHAERVRLDKGEHPVPVPPYTRAPDVRTCRPGAPLWQLLDFADHVTVPDRTGLEAALEASGLLDAWVTPDGIVLDADTRDVLLAPRAARASSLHDWMRPAAQDLPVSSARVAAILASIACAPDDPADAEAWISPQGRFRLGPARGAWSKADPQYIGFAAREAARRRRLLEVEAQLVGLTAQLAGIDVELQSLAAQRATLNEECRRAPSDGALRDAHARFSAAESDRRLAQERLAEADTRLHEAEQRWNRVREALEHDAQDLRLPADPDALTQFERKLGDYNEMALDLTHAARDCRRSLSEVAQQARREEEALSVATFWREEYARRTHAADEATARRNLLREAIGAAVAELGQRLAQAQQAVVDGERLLREETTRFNEAIERRATSRQKAEDAQQTVTERQQRRQEAVERLQAFARTGLLFVALAPVEAPDAAVVWTVDPALQLARRIEQALSDVASDDADWMRIQSDIARDFNVLVQAMSAQGHQAQGEPTDYGLIVHIVYQNRPERPDILEQRIGTEIAQRREILTAREREVLENHLEAEVATALQKLLQEAERRLQTINAELARRPTSTGVRFRLEWEPLPEGDNGAPVGLAAARARLLRRTPDAWSSEDRRVIGEFLQNRIQIERSRDEGVGLLDHLTRALDYRRWHRFRIKRFQDGAWRPLAGPASSGERALGLTVPLFAAASSHYASADYAYAPRLVLLDEAFAGIDDEARAHCMALIREFDLDFVMTSEREWGCYAELPGLAICHLVRRDGVDAVYVSRWSWDGRARREELDPSRRFPERADVAA
ncbi:MAG: TIGR02680 family protein [Betaproteobacteria bacterium RIFCSPLOWO2_12_FULL_62_13]|nr:MAG: TIGR02680 family protein [Betaproteobacteria bacterium RIFCSPLOWO2_12_FULL_62_13]